MPNLPYMPDSHLIDAISVRASGHHHRGLCVPMTRPLIVGPQFQQPDFHALTRSSRYAYSSHVHVLVCLLCVVPFVVAHVRFHCAALVSFRAVVLCGGVSCYHGVCVPLCCAVHLGAYTTSVPKLSSLGLKNRFFCVVCLNFFSRIVLFEVRAF